MNIVECIISSCNTIKDYLNEAKNILIAAGQGDYPEPSEMKATQEDVDNAVMNKWVDAELIRNYIVETGSIIIWTKDTPPEGYLECNGAELSRTTYAKLFSVIGTTFGDGDGSTTFNLPDLRGEFIRGWDDGRGVDENRLFGSNQGDAIRNFYGELGFGGGNEPKFTFANGIFYPTRRVDYYSKTTDTSGTTRYDAAVIDASKQLPTANEIRPRNIALMFCIKY